MALEPLKKHTPFIKAALLTKGQAVKGHLLGSWVNEEYPDRKAIKLALSEDQVFKIRKKDGETVTEETVNMKKGDQVILQGAGNLKYFFQDGPQTGALYHFVYGGLTKIKKGPSAGKESHNFEILRDLDDTIAVGDKTEATEDLPF